MTDALEILYRYAEEHMLCALLAEEPGYAEARLYADRKEDQFLALLDGTARESLAALMDEQSQLDFYRARALFRAGFRLALELARA